MNTNDLPVKKIYIDTKFRRHDSVSTSNFKIELPSTLKFPDNTIFYVDDVCIPHVWHTVEIIVNDKLYVRTILNNVNTDYILTLTAQNYSGNQMAVEIDAKIRTLMDALGNALNPSVGYYTQTQTLSLSILNLPCKIMTDIEMRTAAPFAVNTGFHFVDTNNLDSVNDLLTNTGIISTIGTSATPVKFNLNLQPIRNLYLRSPNISSFTTIGCNGENSIIKKIPATSKYGDMIFNNITAANDFLDCSRQTWKTIEFHLLDVNSQYINLHGSNISFSLILDKQSPNQ